MAQDTINQRAAEAHWRAYNAALAAGMSKDEAMRAAEAARRAINLEAK